MSKATPRASLSITILDDEDFHVLLALPGGLEAFGAFCSLLIVGRERFQQGKALRLGETDSLVFMNSLGHVLNRARIDRPALGRALAALAATAAEAGSEPWLTLDGERLVIRSFFKYHSPPGSGWGGHRGGAGRKSRNHLDSENNQDDSDPEIKMKTKPGIILIPRKNHLDSENNQDDSEINQDDSFPNQVGNHLDSLKESSRKPSVSDSNAIAKPAGTGVRAREREPDPEACALPDTWSHQDCVELAAALFGDTFGNDVTRSQGRLKQQLERRDGRPCWDALAAGLKYAKKAMAEAPNTIDRPIGLAITKAQEWIALETIPPDPIEAAMRPPPPRLSVHPKPHVADAGSIYGTNKVSRFADD